ncbi:MAG: adenosylcobinamide-GDP ribazoletransferase [Oscillospiraceae bacterium]
MKLLRGLCAAFSMYSAIPVPHVAWDEDSLRWALCCFPLVGVVIGGLFWLWTRLAAFLSVSNTLSGAIGLLISVLLSGGIHLDGFCDTADALASHQSRERRLEILKDSHVGAFAVISCGLYLICFFALLCETASSEQASGVIALSFVLSRALSALCAVTLRCARGDGMLATFTNAADTHAVILCSATTIGLCAAAMLVLWPTAGGGAVLAGSAVLCYYRWMSRRRFGGITGDLAGWFLCLFELAAAAGAVAATLLIGGNIA